MCFICFSYQDQILQLRNLTINLAIIIATNFLTIKIVLKD